MIKLYLNAIAAAFRSFFHPPKQNSLDRLTEFLVTVEPDKERVWTVTQPHVHRMGKWPEPKRLPSAFTMLGVDEQNHSFIFETLYMDVARERLHKFGDIQEVSTEKRWGYDLHGQPRPFIYTQARIDVSTVHSLDKALNRAKSLENMELLEAFKLHQQLAARQERNYAEELFNAIAISGNPAQRLIIFVTALQGVAMAISGEECKMVHQESASEDNSLRRYYYQVPPAFDFNGVIQGRLQIIQEHVKDLVVQGDVWDIWRNGDDE